MLPLLPDYQVSQDRNDRGDHLLWDLSDPAPCLWQAGIDLTFSSLCCYSLTLKTPPPCEVIFFCSRQEVQGVMLGGGGGGDELEVFGGVLTINLVCAELDLEANTKQPY